MQAKVRNELRMLRELVNHWATGGHTFHDKTGQAICCFCKTRLFANPSTTFGHKQHLAVRDQITVHHRDGNHNRNEPSNRTLAHRSCHKAWHLRLLHKTGVFKRVRAAKKAGRR